MADKKPAAKKDEPKVAAPDDETPTDVADARRAGEPLNYDAQGDAHAMPTDPETGYVVDPLLAPESQQAGESAEHYAERRAQMPKQN